MQAKKNCNMATCGQGVVKKDFSMDIPNNASISIPMSNASRAMNDFITKGTREALFTGGYKECIEKMDRKEIKYGRILALVRSFEHHMLRETGVQDSILAGVAQILLKPTIQSKAKRKLEQMGQAERYFDLNHNEIRLHCLLLLLVGVLLMFILPSMLALIKGSIMLSKTLVA